MMLGPVTPQLPRCQACLFPCIVFIATPPTHATDEDNQGWLVQQVKQTWTDTSPSVSVVVVFFCVSVTRSSE